MKPPDLRGLRLRSAVAPLLADLGHRPLLSAEEEAELGRRIHDGDADARDELVLRNIRLVICIARKFSDFRAIDFEDCIGLGCCGLMEAVDRFDPGRGTRFSTFASYVIRRAINRAINNRIGPFTAPQDTFSRYRRGLCGWRNAAFVERVLGMVECDEIRRESIACGDPGPDEVVEEEDTRGRFLESLRGLPPRMAFVLRRYYGLDGEPMDFPRIGLEMGLTKQRIHQIHKAALKELARAMGLETTHG